MKKVNTKNCTFFCTVALFLIFSFCKPIREQERKDGFEISGTVKGMPDSVLLYLFNPLQNQIVDSALVINEKFKLKGSHLTHPVNMPIVTADQKYFSTIWVENGEFSFDATIEEFFLPKITGNKTQQEEDKAFLPIKKVAMKLYFQEMRNPELTEQEKTILAQKFDSILTEKSKLILQFAKNNPNSIISAYMLDDEKKTLEKEALLMLSENLSNEVKNTTYGKSLIGFLKQDSLNSKE